MRVGKIRQIANQKFNMKKLLKRYDYLDHVGQSHILCPFHDDINNPSARYFEDTDKLYCFTERKLYGAYDMLRKVGLSNKDIIDYLPDNVKLDKEKSQSNIDEDKLKNIRQEFFKKKNIDRVVSNIVNCIEK